MPAVLLMLSGGLDSTYLLHHFLTRTDLAVHAHHISIRYPHVNRWRAEAEAVKRIVHHCSAHHRPFTYSESVFALGIAGEVGWDSDLQLLVASKVVPSIQSRWVTVALGWSVEDMQRPVVAARSQQQITPNLWRALWASIDKNAHINPVLAMPLIEQSITKAAMLQTLPRELTSMCWSCRAFGSAATTSQPCGHCQACTTNKQALQSAGLHATDFPNLVAN